MEDILKVAVNTVKGVASDYSKGQTSEALRAAFIEMNGGTEKLNPRTFVRGNALFALVEELLPVIIEEGLKDDNPIFKLVEYKNIAYGDKNEFLIEGDALFVVADAAAGIRGVRRQRISGGSTVSVKTSMKMVRVYENLGRLLAGRITFDKFVDGVEKAFKQAILMDAYKALNSISASTAGLNSTYVKGGVFSENDLITLIDHVEAATGKIARIYGTRSALRKITTAQQGNEINSDMYNLGYYGKFNGTDMIVLKQAHKTGSSEFVFSDNKIYILAGDDAPVKMVNEGQGIIINREATENNDLTQEYIYGQGFGAGVAVSEKMGIWTFS